MEQEAKGKLERQKISDEADAEKARKKLLELQAESAAVESTGQAKAEAQSKAWTSKIEAEAAVEQAELKRKAQTIEWVNKTLIVLMLSIPQILSLSSFVKCFLNIPKHYTGRRKSKTLRSQRE